MSNYFESPQEGYIRQPYFWKLIDRLGYIVASLFGVAVLLVVLMFFGILQFDYLEVVRNDPLKTAVPVTKVVGRTVHLADGRLVVLDRFDDPAAVLNETDGRLELETVNGRTSAFVSQERFICDTGFYRGFIQIPLIPSRVDGNRRWQVSANAKVLPAVPANNTP
jgi:hypothetical protein